MSNSKPVAVFDYIAEALVTRSDDYFFRCKLQVMGSFQKVKLFLSWSAVLTKPIHILLSLENESNNG